MVAPFGEGGKIHSAPTEPRNEGKLPTPLPLSPRRG